MKKLFSLLLAGLISTPCVFAAVVAYSPPVGGMTVSVPTGQTRSIALALSHDPVGAGAVMGKITGVGSNYVEVSSAGWTAGSFSNSSNPYYLRIKSGLAAGRVMPVSSTANTATRLYVINDGVDLAAAGIATNDSYEIVLADTLSTLFDGANLQGGSGYLLADNVQVWSGADWLVFYYNTTRSRWELRTDTAASPSRSNYVLRPDRGIMITRRAGSELRMHVTGRVPLQGGRHFHAYPGVTFVSTGLPININLGNLSMQTRAANWASGSLGSAALTNADLIQVWSGADWLVFYHNSVRNRWELNTDTSASPSRDSYAIQAGRPIMIRRLGSPATAAEKLILLPSPYSS